MLLKRREYTHTRKGKAMKEENLQTTILPNEAQPKNSYSPGFLEDLDFKSPKAFEHNLLRGGEWE